jgi:hypothetical protein
MQSLKDKFITEDIDDLFGTSNDILIAECDIPERLQIKIGDRLLESIEDSEKSIIDFESKKKTEKDQKKLASNAE